MTTAGCDLKFPHLGSELNSMWDLAREPTSRHFEDLEQFWVGASAYAALPNASLLEDLKAAKFIFGFIDKNYPRQSYVDKDHPQLWFLVMPIDENLSVVVVNVNHHQKNISSLLSAEYAGMVEMLQAKQLPYKYIEAWIRIRQSYKYLCVVEVVDVLKSEVLTQAYLSYSRYFDKKQYHQWKQEFGIEMRICRSRRQMISSMTKMIIEKTK